MTTTTAASTTAVAHAQLRARFAVALAEMYGAEVPAYTTLVEVSRAVNADVAAARGADAERLGSLERVTAERHGAIRVGSERELERVGRVFAAFGMHPVGFYDLRDASASSVPVVSTAFRPVDPAELAANPFRVFTSLLAVDDARFFDAPTRLRLERFVEDRRLFSPELLALADRSAAEGGLPPAEADELLRRATDAFRLSTEPVDRAWYTHLERISAVAADIGGVPATHINHLTPRVLDIDELYRRMSERGITMIDEVQGPPAWEGPDVLLRQTSFRALAEERTFREADGSVTTGALRVRFGEVEQRGTALTAAGRDLYDRLVAEVDARRAAGDQRTRVEVARDVWREHLPRTEAEMVLAGLACGEVRLVDAAALPARQADGSLSLRALVESGAVVVDPVVYEDFLPRSAAGIFQSNLDGAGTKDDGAGGAEYDAERLSAILGQPVLDPIALATDQMQRSLDALSAQLQTRLTH
ncbi:2-oxoadipate dioxygenase/decarboxylase [Quadrisphaera sp. KR29]|uniref:2-oxoadipate dioxygenase/decarboxylase n=1 Tax=Quadrisphaera sp. KR29 TaxID=3461391 RepID=UPI0040444C2A